MSVSGRGREYNSIYSNTAYRIIGQLGLYGTAAKPKCQSVDELDSFHGSIIRSIDEEGDKRWMEEKDDERERERRGHCCRWFIVKIEGLASYLPLGGEAACTYVNAWAGHATERRTGFSSFPLYSELYGCFVTSSERESRCTPRHLNIHAVPRCTRAMSK